MFFLLYIRNTHTSLPLPDRSTLHPPARTAIAPSSQLTLSVFLCASDTLMSRLSTSNKRITTALSMPVRLKDPCWQRTTSYCTRISLWSRLFSLAVLDNIWDTIRLHLE